MLEVAGEELEPASPCPSAHPSRMQCSSSAADDPNAVANPNLVGAADATTVTDDVVDGCMVMDTKAWLKIMQVVTPLKTGYLHEQSTTL